MVQVQQLVNRSIIGAQRVRIIYTVELLMCNVRRDTAAEDFLRLKRKKPPVFQGDSSNVEVALR